MESKSQESPKAENFTPPSTTAQAEASSQRLSDLGLRLGGDVSVGDRNLSQQAGSRMDGGLGKADREVGGSWSLSDCLKKNLTIRGKRADVGAEPVPHKQDSMEEGDDVDDMTADDFDFKDEEFDNPVTLDPAFQPQPTLFARCMCLQFVTRPVKLDRLLVRRKGVQQKHKARYPKFLFTYQNRHVVVKPQPPVHKIARFNFAMPSPDDIVKEKQKAAFTRTGP
jgi:hypothetical protein